MTTVSTCIKTTASSKKNKKKNDIDHVTIKIKTLKIETPEVSECQTNTSSESVCSNNFIS